MCLKITQFKTKTCTVVIIQATRTRPYVSPTAEDFKHHIINTMTSRYTTPTHHLPPHPPNP